MRAAVSFVAMIAIALGVPALAQDTGTRPEYLSWSAAAAERTGKSTRVDGRVGGAFDLRVVHTERSYNYKLRATWLTKDVIQATARLQQLSERLTDSQTEALVHEATAAGEVVFMVEVDPREGSGVIPNDWSAFLGPSGSDAVVARGVNTPALEKVKGLHGVYRRDYDYDQFWVVFPLTTADGATLFSSGVAQATLTVRISGKEGRVSLPIPAYLRTK
jgi:hypothetical protein